MTIAISLTEGCEEDSLILMSVRLHNITTWVTFSALVLTLLMGSGVLVYCVGPSGHAAIEIVHEEHPRENPIDEQEDSPAGDWVTNVVSASECVDQTMAEQAFASVTCPSQDLIITAPYSLLYELPPLEDLSTFSHFSRLQGTSVHPDFTVAQSVILLI